MYHVGSARVGESPVPLILLSRWEWHGIFGREGLARPLEYMHGL
jgi:hypothetical protein